MIQVTGIAWSTPLGESIEGVWDALMAGQTGLQPLAHTGRLRNELAGAVSDPPMEMPARGRMHELGMKTARRAMESAGVDAASNDALMVLGTSLGSYLEDPADDSTYTWASRLAKDLGIGRAPMALSTACSSGSDAILLGAEMLRAGEARCCICGGVDVVTWSKRIGHSTLGTMSPTMLRAFDERHDGTLLGEGAAFVVLENVESARKPGMAILRGCGSANDATGMTSADVTGLSARYAIERSLADADLPASAIGLINAHGSGTVMNDTTEKACFREAFPQRPGPLVFATKGNFGHTLGATGTMEAIALILALRSGWAPPVAGLEQLDPDVALPVARGKPVAHHAHCGLSLTLGFGGFDTSLIFEVTR